MSQIDNQRSIIVQSKTKSAGVKSIYFLNDVLKDLKAYHIPEDSKDSHLHEMIRLYASLIIANLTMTEVYGIDGSAVQNLGSNDPLQYNIKAILKKHLSFSYFFPPSDTTNPLILRLCALCISELLELESNRSFSDNSELVQVVEVVMSLANEIDTSCAYYGMKALCLLTAEKNQDVLLQCGALSTFYEASRKIKDPNVLKYVWQGFKSMAKYLDKALNCEAQGSLMSKSNIPSSFSITTDRTDGFDFTTFRYPVVIPKQDKIYFEIETVHGGNIFLGFAPENWKPVTLQAVGMQEGTVSFNGFIPRGFVEGSTKEVSSRASAAEIKPWEPGTIVSFLVDKKNSSVEVFFDGKPINGSISLPSQIENFVFVTSMYKSEGLVLNFGQEKFHFPTIASTSTALYQPSIQNSLQFWSNGWSVITPSSSFMMEPRDTEDNARPLQRAKALMYLSNIIPLNDSYFHEPFKLKSSSFPFTECVTRLGVSKICISGLKINFSTITDRKEKLLIYSDPLCSQLVREYSNSDKYFAQEENDLVVFSDCVYFRFLADNYFIDNILQPTFEALIRPDYTGEIDSSLLGLVDEVYDSGKEILAMFESEHNYADNMHAIYPVAVSQDVDVVEITFDEQTYTENSYDYVQFFLDEKCETSCSSKFSGDSYPGKGNNPPLRIAANRFWFLFHSDGSSNYWGYKMFIRKDVVTSVRKMKEDDFSSFTKKELLADKIVQVAVQEGGHTKVAFDETFTFSFYDTLQVYLEDPAGPNALNNLKPNTIICNKATAAYIRAKHPELAIDNILEYDAEGGINIPYHSLFLKWVSLEPDVKAIECLNSNHQLEVKKTGNSWSCDICSVSYSSSTKRRNCLTCDYDLCFACVPRSLHAHKGKTLEARVCFYRNFDPLGALRGSSEGNSLKFGTIHPYVDNMNEEFEIDLTSLSHPQVRSGDVNELFPDPCCWRGHTMVIEEGRYWNCDFCRDSEGRRQNCRWHCENCDYDVCFPCHDPRDNTDPPHCRDETHVMKKTVGGSWNCDVCREYQGRVRRWKCTTCDFDKCFICAPERANERARCRELCIVFDPRSATEENCDYMQFSAVTQEGGNYDTLFRYGRERQTGQFSQGMMPSLEKPLFIYHPPIFPTDTEDFVDREGQPIVPKTVDKNKLFYRFYSDSSRVGKYSYCFMLFLRFIKFWFV